MLTFEYKAATIDGGTVSGILTGSDRQEVAGIRAPGEQNDIGGWVFETCDECPTFVNEVRLQEQKVPIKAISSTKQRIHAARVGELRVVDKLDRMAKPGEG